MPLETRLRTYQVIRTHLFIQFLDELVVNNIWYTLGIIAPGLGLFLLQWTGSWMPLFWLTAALQCLTGLAFGKLASISDARTLLAVQRQRSLGS